MNKGEARYAEKAAVSYPSSSNVNELTVSKGGDLGLTLTSIGAFGAVGCQLLALLLFNDKPFVLGSALLLYLCLLSLLWRALPMLPQEGWFGWANSVTLLRSSWLCLLMAEGLTQALGLVPLSRGSEALGLAGLAAAFLLLDGLDGWLARRRRAETVYGARFDNEVDGLFVMAVSLLLLAQGAVAGWLVLAGAVRYGFLLLGRLYPSLASHFPGRTKHKTVFVVFSLLLIWGLWPGWSVWVGHIISLSALVYLIVSFAADLYWLLLHRS